jgi:hypothetical protein
MAKIYINREIKNDDAGYKTISSVYATPVQISSLTWFNALTPQLQELVTEAVLPFINEIEEIRLRINRPIVLPFRSS